MLQAAGKRVLSVKRALIGSPVLVSPVINGQTTNSKRKQRKKLLARRTTQSNLDTYPSALIAWICW